ncbi:MAG: CDC27 family protein [Muribaculaceae bacterium]|nr:CDC27 family protein [Muribaculaceae bacterium]
MKQTYLFIISLLITLSANASMLDSAKILYNNHEYSKALPIFRGLLAKSPKDASLNQWTGVCLYNIDSINDAIPLLKFADSKSVIEASRYLAYIAYKQYRFDDAETLLNKYQNALSKAKKEIPGDIDLLSTRILNARNMLDRVEHIQIIDSINVDRDAFFKHYKLSSNCGSLNPISILPQTFASTQVEIHPESLPLENIKSLTNTAVFQPESKTQMIWSMNDYLGTETIVLSSILSDGTWETPQLLNENLCNGNSNYPFIMPDGITLYFANDGENSIGGYDIFISRKDEDGFLQPQNMGMPYNSPYNDYMLVIDEFSGIGWWATDRNNIKGKITIYMFIPNESRVNYPSDDTNIINLAKINSITDSWIENTDYSKILERLNNIGKQTNNKLNDSFTLTLPNGNIYTSFTDFKNNEAMEAMKEYINAIDLLQSTKNQLSTLRKTFAQGDKSVSQEILETEKSILTQQENLINLRNKVVKLECN